MHIETAQPAIELSLPAWLVQAGYAARTCADDDARIALAIELARRNVEAGSGGPFGAAVFDQDGRPVALGVNRVLPMTCSIAHAEIMALAGAQQALRRARLNQDGKRYVLAASAQPCCQCYGAIVWAGLDGLLIGARGEDVEALTDFDEGPLPADWAGELQRRGIAVRRDLRREEACAVLAEYMRRGGAHY